ncbi:MAG: hypothetical protein U0X91_08905 [Spirosomataceae bacterium]
MYHRRFFSLLAGLIFFFLTHTAKSQDYRTAVGLRAGGPKGFTIKHFTKPKVAVEGIISSRWHGLGFTGLIEGHTRAFDINRLNFYYGAGAHIYFWGEGKRGYSPYGRESVVGIDGILGLEYNFREIPINLAIDWKPTFNLNVDDGFWGDDGAISIRYAF